ncbi:MAG: MerR family transcriptional regulator [Pseudomonadota bacterium]
MSSKTRTTDHDYGIGAVAKVTGLTDHTIRVWERRYRAVVAGRAANGRRVYSPEDVEKLGLLKQLTDRGLSIGQIATDDIDTLRDRLRSIGEFSRGTVPDRIGLAILGDFLPARLANEDQDVAPLDVIIADDNRDTFVADLARHQVDVVLLESPTLDDAVIKQLGDYMAAAGADRGVIVYSFGRARDADLARDARMVALRAPTNVEEVRAAVLRAYAPIAASAPRPASPSATESSWHFSGPVAPRRFNNQQLTRLTRASTAIDCECPHHLAQLVGDLTAFEIYSAQCANRDENDAALHRYLHQTTAQARALIEAALERVADAEGISY